MEVPLPAKLSLHRRYSPHRRYSHFTDVTLTSSTIPRLLDQLEQEIEEKRRQMRAIEKQIVESNEASISNTSLADMQQTMMKLMTQCDEKGFELEIVSADNRILQEEWHKKKIKNCMKEAIKQKLCDDLNNLVQESSSSQFARLEELKRRLEALNPRRSSAFIATAESPVVPASTTPSPDVSVPNSVEPPTESSKKVSNESNNQKTSAQVDGNGKKKNAMQGRGRGIGAVPKSRGSSWTGAGFD